MAARQIAIVERDPAFGRLLAELVALRDDFQRELPLLRAVHDDVEARREREALAKHLVEEFSRPARRNPRMARPGRRKGRR